MLYKKFSDQWRENADTQNPDRATLAALATLAGAPVGSRIFEMRPMALSGAKKSLVGSMS